MRSDVFAAARAAACVCLLFASGGTPAQSANETLPGIAAAVRRAWAQHPAAEATERTLAAARARAQAAAQPLYNPELEVEFEDEGEERRTTAGVGWTLDLSGKRRARSALGQATLSLAEAEANQRRVQFALAWLQAWAERLAANERVRVGQQRVALVERFADLADRQRAAGDISTLERDLAYLAREEARAEQAGLLSDAASAEESFRSVGGNVDDVPTPTDLAPPVTSDEIEVTSIVEARVAAATATNAQQQVAVAQRDRRPDPTVHLTTGRIDFGPASDNVVGVSVSVPLFVRNPYRAEVTAAHADADAAHAERRRVELEVVARAERTQRTYAAMRAAWTQWSQSPGTDVAMRSDLLERLWRAGELSTADYLTQLKQTLDTSLAGAELHGRLWRSYVDMLYATGRLDGWVGFDSNSEVNP
jgi:cobalt-zinc-cadmium efflux system outer membrane protein